jgi:3-hydroxyisobutyrate dehydrogenase
MGRMGRALAARLLAGGHEVTVWNRSATDTSSLTAAGARVAPSLGDAAQAGDVVVTSLSDDAAVRAVALGDAGVCATMSPRAVYVDCSTVSPATSEALAAACSRFVALPVLGGPAAVQGGTATYLAGAAAATLDTIEPVLASLSANVRRFGDARLAACAKVTCNLLLLVGVAGLAEAIAVGRAGGLSDDQLRGLLAQSPLVAPALANRFEAVLNGATEGWWSVRLGAKDAALAAETAARAGRDLPVAAAVRDLFARAAATGFGDADIAAVARLYAAPPPPTA